MEHIFIIFGGLCLYMFGREVLRSRLFCIVGSVLSLWSLDKLLGDSNIFWILIFVTVMICGFDIFLGEFDDDKEEEDDGDI